jgi:hypothetical protein
MIGVGPQRGDGVAGAGLDPDIGRARGKAEHQQRMRPVMLEQFRQLAVDGLVGHRENMPGQFDIAERGAAQAH